MIILGDATSERTPVRSSFLPSVSLRMFCLRVCLRRFIVVRSFGSVRPKPDTCESLGEERVVAKNDHAKLCAPVCAPGGLAGPIAADGSFTAFGSRWASCR